MANTTYVPSTNEGVGDMLTAFVTNIGPLAAKYGVTPEDIASVAQGKMVWDWFQETLVIARGWAAALTANRDGLFTGNPGTFDPMPDPPALPPVPNNHGVPPTPIQIQHAFFAFFAALVSSIKKNQHYDPADGRLLGIEGKPVPKPLPSVVPVATVEIFTSGHPEVSCVKGPFQGFNVYLTRPGAVRKLLGTSLSRRYVVNEPLPAPGTAEIWVFEVQYIYQNAPFGQMSLPVSVTVRG